MKKCGEKFFINIVSNVIILAIVIGVFAFCFADRVILAFQTNEYTKPYYSGDASKAQVSLMVNVYWGNEYVEPMLETMREQGIKASFFIGGMWAEKYPELLIKISDAGHEIANHGYFHLDQDKLTLARNKEEIVTAERMIEAKCGIKTVLFAPPSGAFSKSTLEAADQLGYKVIMWSKDTIDWRDKNAELIYTRATKKPKNGDLILMHPTQATAQALERIIRFYKDNGYSLVTVSRNIGLTTTG